MQVKTGRLDTLVPHMLRSQFLRPGFVRLSLQMGVARAMPAWAKLQFIHNGVSADDLEWVLGRIDGLESWADQWQALAERREKAGLEAAAAGRVTEARDHMLAASAAYNFSQYVLFVEPARKQRLHEACVRTYAHAAPHFDPPAVPFDVPFHGRTLKGLLRVPAGEGPRPVVVLFHGTNAVKEELHWWGEALVRRGMAVVLFDGPGLGETFHRLAHVAEPRPMGVAIVNHIETFPELDPDSVAFMGLSLGGYCVIRMAAHDKRIRAVAAISPPYSADVYWNVTLHSLRTELAALYSMRVEEMDKHIPRITLEDALPDLTCPLMLASGGHDIITPPEEAQRIFAAAHCERELIYYPRGAHDCFNVLGDLRPRVIGWLGRQLSRHHEPAPRPRKAAAPRVDGAFVAGEAVDPDFADELRGEMHRQEWHEVDEPRNLAARFRWPWTLEGRVEVVRRVAMI